MSKKSCVIYANCQGLGILHFLMKHGEFTEDFNIILFSNFQIILEKIPLPLEAFKRADLFIYQPLSKRHGPYSSDNVINGLHKNCKALSFPYIYNDALWPFAPSGSGLKGGEILSGLLAKGCSNEAILAAFRGRSLDCEFDRRFAESISILEEREAKTDVKISHFIQKNLSQKKLFLSQSHPTSPVFIHCVDQILNRLGYSQLPSTLPFSLNEVNYIQCWPTSPYEIEHYRFEYVDHEDPGWKTFFAEEIENFLIKAAPTQNQSTQSAQSASSYKSA